MRILWVKVGGLWPATVGGRLRSLHTISALARRHEVTVLTTYGAAGDDPPGLARELAHCRRVESFAHVLPKRGSARWGASLARSWLSSLPLDLWKCRVPSLADEVQHCLQDEPQAFDLCIADFLVAASNVPLGTATPVVHFSHNVEHRLWKRLCDVETRPWRRALLALEWRKMRRAEADVCVRTALTIAVSEHDREVLESVAPTARVRAVPTGVDIAYFRPSPTPEKPASLVFTGAMDWYPNEDGMLDFIDTTLPLIQRELASTSLTIVGRNPSPRLRAVHGRHGIVVTGTVDDVRPYVAEAEVYVVPLRIGGGTRLKILEALAMGKAVVATTIGAEGLPLIDGVHFVAADSPEDMSRAVLALLRDPARRAALGSAGRRLVEEEHSWERVALEFEKLCEEAIHHAN